MRLSHVFWFVTFFKLLLIPFYRSTDFEVHRNWLALTHSLPVSQWYFEATSEWTLDYPPFFAWFEYGLSQLAYYFDPQMLVVSNLNYASAATVLFQRLSVIAADAVLFMAICYYCKVAAAADTENDTSSQQHHRKTVLVVLLTFANPGLLLVDHVHFQYNGVLYGLLILSLALIRHGYTLAGAATFAALLNFKHIFIYIAPVFFIFLLSSYVAPLTLPEFVGFEQYRTKRTSRAFFPFNLVVLAGVVIAVFCASLGPFVMLGQLPQVLSRLFPFGKRGLVHAYWAPNVWALYYAADKAISIAAKGCGSAAKASMTGGLVESAAQSPQCLPNISPMVTLAGVVLMMAPGLVKLWRNPHPSLLTPVLSFVALCSFMLGWHVHEKAILMVTIPLALGSLDSLGEAKLYFFLNTVATFSLFPLLFGCAETPLKLLVWLFYSGVCWCVFTIEQRQQQQLRRIEFSGLLNAFEKGYLAGLLVVQLFTSVIHPLFLSRWEFLPLMVTSVYCACGYLYSWCLAWGQIRWRVRHLELD